MTSQLDAVNEAALRETIGAAARETTVPVVAHRLSTVTMVIASSLRTEVVRTLVDRRDLVMTAPCTPSWPRHSSWLRPPATPNRHPWVATSSLRDTSLVVSG